MFRSQHLALKYFAAAMTLFGIMVLFYIVIIIVGLIVGLIATGSVGLAAAMNGGIFFGIVNGIAQTFVAMVSTVGIAAIYLELRRIREGVDVSGLASVFD